MQSTEATLHNMNLYRNRIVMISVSIDVIKIVIVIGKRNRNPDRNRNHFAVMNIHVIVMAGVIISVIVSANVTTSVVITKRVLLQYFTANIQAKSLTVEDTVERGGRKVEPRTTKSK